MLQKFKSFKRWQQIVIILIPLAILGRFIPHKEDISSSYQRSTSDCSMAKVIAEDYVKSQLKAPSTAKFPDKFECNQIDYYTYRVFSVVDAQNSFGAMLRNRFSVKMKYKGSGSDADPRNWEFSDFVMLGK